MDKRIKDSYLRDANEHIAKIQGYLVDEEKKVQLLVDAKVTGAKIEDKWTGEYIKSLNKERLVELEKLHGSPYFSKCSCTIEGVTKDYYFGKFSFVEGSIYSWVAPVAAIRFDAPGPVSYPVPNGKVRSGELHSKDEYQITDGKILFYSTESKGNPRQLIHQEFFSIKKSGFLLPEIVSKMEKAQDTIIRASYNDPFVVSGPAGSGKTTLALHRIAYLMQSPSSAEIYKNSPIAVFVQDQRSKDYFSHLLPDLGITTVSIVTFAEWAMQILADGETSAVDSYSKDLLYEQEKIKAMRQMLSGGAIPKLSKNHFRVLEKAYKDSFSEGSSATFNEQRKQNVLDRIDLALLLSLYKADHKNFVVSRRTLVVGANQNLVEKTRRNNLKYTLVVIDEFQNYLPEQLLILKSCVDEEHKSIIYVGDIGQQINPGAIRDWFEIGESIRTDRQVVLNKVYRNTKKILQFIGSLGYRVDIPEQVKEGTEVVKNKFASKAEVVAYVNGLVNKRQDKESIGILGITGEDLSLLRESIETNELVHILTVRESQGLEFDTVCLVGFDEASYFERYKEFPEYFRKEKQKIDKDLLYIGLTRAISNLHVIS